MNNKAQKWKEKQKLIIVDKTMPPILLKVLVVERKAFISGQAPL